TWSSHNCTAGLEIDTIQALDMLEFRTETGTCEVTVMCGPTGDILVRAGRFFPEFTAARLAGSSLGGSFLRLRGIYAGFNVEIHVGRKLIVTSRVSKISLAA